MDHHNFGNRGDSDLLKWEDQVSSLRTQKSWCITCGCEVWWESLCYAMKTKLTTCLKDGVRAWWAVWRCKACQNSSGGLLKVQRDKLGAITALLLFGHDCSYQLFHKLPGQHLRALMGMGQASQRMCCCLGSMGNQRASSQGCCVLLFCRFSTNAAGFAPSLGCGATSHSWNMACLWRKSGVSSLLLLTLLIWVLPVLTESYHYCWGCFLSSRTLSMITCRDQVFYRKSVQMLRSYQMAVIPQLIAV